MNWVNQKNLDELSVDIIETGLVIADGGEKAVVDVIDGQISSVRFTDGVRPREIIVGEAKIIEVGAGNTARTVRHFLFPGGPSSRLRLGQTFHNGLGTWSSLPHDFELTPELGFEEFFRYYISGGSGIAHQIGRGVWRDGLEVDATWQVANGDFATIPMGYHPVVGEPGVVVSYIWAYLVKSPHWEKI